MKVFGLRRFCILDKALWFCRFCEQPVDHFNAASHIGGLAHANAVKMRE
jgi:hypothetical protein